MQTNSHRAKPSQVNPPPPLDIQPPQEHVLCAVIKFRKVRKDRKFEIGKLRREFIGIQRVKEEGGRRKAKGLAD